jgi:hypothetical protein
MSTDYNKELVRAIQNNDFIRLEVCLVNGGNPHHRIDYTKFRTPMYWAFMCNCFTVINTLLEFKADINFAVEDMSGQTILYGAIFNKNRNLVEYLILKGANINFKDNDGFTPLYSILDQAQNSLNLVPVLLKGGADLRIGMEKINLFLDPSKRPFLERFIKKIAKYFEKLIKKSDRDDLPLQKFSDQIVTLCKCVTDSVLHDLARRAKQIRREYALENELDSSSW